MILPTTLKLQLENRANYIDKLIDCHSSIIIFNLEYYYSCILLNKISVLIYSGDTFTVCMENITAFIDGPLAFLATYAFLRNTSYRYVVQLVLSLCQLYGDVLYMVIEWKDGFPHGPYGHPLYFWFYFVFLNTFWIIVPLACILESWYQLTTAHATVDRLIPISDNMYNVPDRINTSANHKNMKKQK